MQKFSCRIWEAAANQMLYFPDPHNSFQLIEDCILKQGRFKDNTHGVLMLASPYVDKTGKRIYAGDIFKVEAIDISERGRKEAVTYYSLVTYDEDSAAWCDGDSSFMEDAFDRLEDPDCKNVRQIEEVVVGNFFENPDLQQQLEINYIDINTLQRIPQNKRNRLRAL